MKGIGREGAEEQGGGRGEEGGRASRNYSAEITAPTIIAQEIIAQETIARPKK